MQKKSADCLIFFQTFFSFFFFFFFPLFFFSFSIGFSLLIFFLLFFLLFSLFLFTVFFWKSSFNYTKSPKRERSINQQTKTSDYQSQNFEVIFSLLPFCVFFYISYNIYIFIILDTWNTYNNLNVPIVQLPNCRSFTSPNNEGATRTEYSKDCNTVLNDVDSECLNCPNRMNVRMNSSKLTPIMSKVLQMLPLTWSVL